MHYCCTLLFVTLQAVILFFFFSFVCRAWAPAFLCCYFINATECCCSCNIFSFLNFHIDFFHSYDNFNSRFRVRRGRYEKVVFKSTASKCFNKAELRWRFNYQILAPCPLLNLGVFLSYAASREKTEQKD